ncbi:hypothetical protein P154DRAFT_378646, partial [Amniculicola lignicola CBS 123094]
MAQGTVKKSSKPSSKKPTTFGPKRGNRVIKPKNPRLIAQTKIKTKRAAGLSGNTEKLLAGKAGHLELLKGGKRDKKAE